MADTTHDSFASFDLIEPIQQALRQAGYLQPTPIQAAAIPPLLEGRDLLGCAQTGTGKTAAFALPILQKIAASEKPPRKKCPRVLVLTPTRELASQIDESFREYGKHLRFRSVTVFGGVSQNRQVRALQRGVHVCIATPGRLLDLFSQGAVWFDQLDTFVLDEADRMLDMGFLPDLKRIIKELPPERQSLFFSATMPKPVRRLANDLLRDCVEVTIKPSAKAVNRIKQRLFQVAHADKFALLQHLLATQATGQALIFTKTKRGADRLVRKLKEHGLAVAAIHGDKTQATRNRVLRQFKSGEVDLLIATDVAARGIDIEGLKHVINYDMPHDPDSYVHRIGRTGRAGLKGSSLTFCTPAEQPQRVAVERLIGKKIAIEREHPYHVNRMVEATAGATAKPRRKKRFRSAYPSQKAKRVRGSTAPDAGQPKNKKRRRT